MIEEEKIASIKTKYKELYGIDVDIQYDENTGKYAVINQDGQIIEIIDSLDKELEQLENLASYNAGGYSSISDTPDDKRKPNKIDIYYSSMINVIGTINKMASSIVNCDTSYASPLTGKLKTYYDGLGDNTKEAINNLLNNIKGVAAATETSVTLCFNLGKENLKELEALINGFYDSAAATLTTDTMLGDYMDENGLISYDDYVLLLDNMDEMYDGAYGEILETLKNDLALRYELFLRDTTPDALDSLIEGIYLNCSGYDENEIETSIEIGSPEYYERLETLKQNFSDTILGNYSESDINSMMGNIPKYLLEQENITDYDKTLLMLSYNGLCLKDDGNNNFKKWLSTSFEKTGLDEYLIEENYDSINTTLKILTQTNDFFNRDFESEFRDYYDYDGLIRVPKKISDYEMTKKIIEEYNNFLKSINLTKASDEVFAMDISLDINQYNENAGTSWRKTLEELGYLKKISGEYTDEELYMSTFNNDFLYEVARTGGQEKVYELLKIYYTKHGLGERETTDKLDEIFRSYNPIMLNSIVNYGINQDVLASLGDVYNKFCQNKITLDASKANFKLGLLKSLDTTGITDSDMEKAKMLIGNNAKYLEDWQIKGYYKLYQENPDTAKLLLDDTLYNIIQNGIGYDLACTSYEAMSEEKIKNLVYQVTKDKYLSEIFGMQIGLRVTPYIGLIDGLIGSMRDAKDFAFADGKMNYRDYYLQHLQEFLSQGGISNNILKITYDVSSSVGNMTIPLALSSFIGPEAMTAWIFITTTGKERREMLQGGAEDDARTWLIASAKGLVSAYTERMLSTLPGYGAKQDDILRIFKMDTPLINKLMNSAGGKMFAKFISTEVNETLQELTENAGGYVIDLISGQGIDWEKVPQETWQTIYMTLLSTPFINLMGEGFQNNKYSLINRQDNHEFNGFEARYSQAELLQFTDANGNIDYNGLLNFLIENNRMNVTTNPNMLVIKNAQDLLSEIQKMGGLQGYQLNPDGSLSDGLSDGWGIDISSEAIEKHIKNLENLSEIGKKRYLEAISHHFELLENPVNNLLIYGDVNYDALIDLFGNKIIKNDNGSYTIDNTVIFSKDINAFIDFAAQTSKDGLIEFISENPSILANGYCIDLLGDPNFDILYETLGNNIFKDDFKSIAEDSESRKKFVEKFNKSQMEQIGKYINHPGMKIKELLERHNYSLVQDLLNNIDILEKLPFKVTDDDFDKSNIYDSNIISNKEDLLIYELLKNDSHFGDKSDIKKLDCIKQALSISKILKVIAENPSMFNNEFYSKHQKIIYAYSLLEQNLNQENASKVKELLNDNYIEMTESLITDIQQVISNDYATKIKQSYDALSSAANGNPIYDIYSEDFSMLIHVIDINPRADANQDIASTLLENPALWGTIEGGNPNLSTSIITPKNMIGYGIIPETKNTNVLIFGFSNIEGHKVLKARTDDSGSSRTKLATDSSIIFDSALYDEMIQLERDKTSQKWTEITLQRYDENGKSIMPDYLICFNEVNELTLKAAKELGKDGKPLPIYVLHTDDIRANIKTQ